MKENLPVLLLKKLSLLPYQEVRIELNNDLSKNIIDLSINSFNNKLIILLPLKPLEETPSVKDLPSVGIVAYIESKIDLPNGNYRVILKGLNRLQINQYANYQDDKSILIANVRRIYIENNPSVEEIAIKRKLLSLLNIYISSSSEVSNSILGNINDDMSLDVLTDRIVNFLKFNFEKRIYYMNEFDELKRAKVLIKDLNIELEINKLNSQLDLEIRDEFEQEQKEYLLKQKIAKINKELGIHSSKEDKVISIRERISKLNVDHKTKNKLFNELERYDSLASNSPESSIISNYLETVLSLPFTKSSEENNDKTSIQKHLDETHYGFNEVKERIIEYALLKLQNKDLKNPIICLVGAPGVGKSSIAQSISKSLNREYFKISVGGLNDSSELIGHSRSYLGATPGKIIQGIMRTGVNNPVILIDEVDKMVKDYKGDPASVLLDILDSNQNQTFIDNYIEEPFDLSKTLFILTANDVSFIPAPLKDRLELIYVDSYNIYDKKDIALNYILPKIFKKYKNKKSKIKDELLLYIIKNYTLESGVRELERILDKVVRKIIIDGITLSKLNKNKIEEYLGIPKYEIEINSDSIGKSYSIGISPLGGNVINIQCLLLEKDDIVITGDIKDKLKDSILIGINYLKTSKLIDFKNKGIHINFNNNYTLDGGSASLAVAVAITSAFTKIKVSSNYAFSGSIDLYGNINRVGSIKEKIITAYNNGFRDMYIPSANESELKNIPKIILDELNIILVDNYLSVYNNLFK